MSEQDTMFVELSLNEVTLCSAMYPSPASQHLLLQSNTVYRERGKEQEDHI